MNNILLRDDNMGAFPTARINKSQSNRTLCVAVGSTNKAKILAAQNSILRSLQAYSRDMGDNGNKITRTSLSNETNLTVENLNFRFEIEGFDVESGVSDQPFGDEETKRGAENRATRSYYEFYKRFGYYPDLAVGMEGGLEEIQNNNQHSEQSGSAQRTSTVSEFDEKTSPSIKTLFCMAWMAVFGQQNCIPMKLLASSSDSGEDSVPVMSVAKSAMFALPPIIVRNILDNGMELGHADDAVFGRVDSGRGSGTVGKLTNDLINRTIYYEHALILALIPWFNSSLYFDDASVE